MRTKMMPKGKVSKMPDSAAEEKSESMQERTKEAAQPGLPGSGDEVPLTPEEEAKAQQHLDTLMEAEKIKADPRHMANVHKMAGRHMKAIKSIQDLKDLHTAKFGNKKTSDEYMG
jgi:hypothetical protein